MNQPMLMLGAAGFTLLAVGAGTLLAMDSRNRIVEQRTRAVASSYAPVTVSAAGRSVRLKGAATNASLVERTGQLIGLEPGRPDLYPVPWWTIPSVMLGFGFLIAKLVVFLIGDIGWIAWPIGWFLGSRALLLHWLTKYRNELIKQLPDALSMIVRTVRAGIPVTEACQVVARESPALTICRLLLEERAILAIHDPRALGNAKEDLKGAAGCAFVADPYEATSGAHAVALLTAWPEYRDLDFRRVFDGMEKPAFLFDGWNFLDHAALAKIGFHVYRVGAAAPA